jgi:hypothetical protein
MYDRIWEAEVEKEGGRGEAGNEGREGERL